MSSDVFSHRNLYKILFVSLGALPPLLFAKHPAHQDDNVPFRVTGGFTLNEARIKELNGDAITVNRYGTTTLLAPKSAQNPNPGPLKDPLTGKEIVIRDQHYTLYDWAKAPLSKWNAERPKLGYGIRIIPAVSGYTGQGKKGEVLNSGSLRVTGSELVDQYLREKVYGYAPARAALKGGNRDEINARQPIFAQIAYMHPEGFQGEPFGLSGEPGLKTEMGFTHKGIYMGDGKTVNSPPRYHGDSWWSPGDTNYPALLNVIDFKGLVDANNNFNVRAFNQNGIMTALVMNETNGGAKFPSEFDYHFDPLYSINLETVLDFYARWIDEDPLFNIDDAQNPNYMKAQYYKQYCAEHATEIINVLLNLPQNVQGYIDVFGEVEGRRLFDKAMDKIFRAPNFRSGEQAQWIRDAYLGKEEEYAKQSKGDSMIPFWKVLNPAQPTPILVKNDDPTAMNAWKATDDKFRGEKGVGYSLGWRPETVADLLKDFAREYLPWHRVGSLTTVPAILGFSREAKTRMNIDTADYVKDVTPIVQQIYLHEAAMEKGLGKISGKSEADLFADFDSGRKMKNARLTAVMQNIALSLQKDSVDANGNVTPGLDPKTTNGIMTSSKSFTSLLAGSGAPEDDAGWQAVSKITTASLARAEVQNTVEGKVAYRQSVYDTQFLPAVKPLLTALNRLDPNPTPELTVKYYYAPAVHVRVVLGFHDQEPEDPNEPNRRDFVRLWPVAHIMRTEETTPIPGNNSATVDDTKFTEYQVL